MCALNATGIEYRENAARLAEPSGVVADWCGGAIADVMSRDHKRNVIPFLNQY
jgi:hypothetical protein